MDEVRATYTIRPDARPEDDRETDPHMRLRFPGPHVSAGVRTYIVVSSAVMAVLFIGLLLAVWALVGAYGKLGGQAAQIHALNQANARMSVQLSQVTTAVKGISGTLNTQTPAADQPLTCADLRKMGLTIATGGTVAAVPGIVNLTQTPVKIPVHCEARRGQGR